ncbi:putative glycosyl hydrolase [Rhizobium sp. PP-F2F-G48]|uniref:cellulase family glycosylhydrolase n=1 Tax=Rhizobium sp. PP-F2F-G48 TaxID=2135651 RepID=UPI0010449969|nr:cellulase family glycosylhydrolase [Rhizobium sp. PP-F2F-G48]TCM57758.1 putative glycosyl hydrolase [Rhizobium sp. PP-F2F-G48]
MRHLFAALLALSAVAISPSAALSQGPEKTIAFDARTLVSRPEPLIIGVGVHFGIGGDMNYVAEASAARLKELGVDSYRDDLVWPIFDQPGSVAGAYQPRQLFDFMAVAGLRPLLILGHGNEQVKEGNPPLTKNGRQAFADFAARAAAATQGFDPIYEIWNEWNVQQGFNPPWLIGAGVPSDKRAAAYYAALAKVAVPAVRKVAPRSTVLSGAVGADQDWQWTKAIIDGGAIRDASALSVHLYNHCDPDETKRTATEMIDRLSLLQERLSGNGVPKPIYVTEFGWPTARKPCVISQQTAADNVSQFLLWSAATPWMKGAWVYQLKDQGRSPDEMEFNFGLYDYDYKPKAAACAVREATRLIKGGKAFRLERPFPDMFVLHVTGDDGQRLVAWTTGAGKTGSLSLGTSEGAPARALCGSGAVWKDGRLTIGGEPVVIDLPKAETVNVTVGLAGSP